MWQTPLAPHTHTATLSYDVTCQLSKLTRFDSSPLCRIRASRASPQLSHASGRHMGESYLCDYWSVQNKKVYAGSVGSWSKIVIEVTLLMARPPSHFCVRASPQLFLGRTNCCNKRFQILKFSWEWHWYLEVTFLYVTFLYVTFFRSDLFISDIETFRQKNRHRSYRHRPSSAEASIISFHGRDVIFMWVQK